MIMDTDIGQLAKANRARNFVAASYWHRSMSGVQAVPSGPWKWTWGQVNDGASAESFTATAFCAGDKKLGEPIKKALEEQGLDLNGKPLQPSKE
jgi:hypothetical protein